MDAILKSIKIVPCTFDKEGEVRKEEHATITLEVPLDSKSQMNALNELNHFLSDEFVKANIVSHKAQE